MRQPRPIHPRLSDSAAYERALRREFLEPFLFRIRDRLAEAAAISDILHAMDNELALVAAIPRDGIPFQLIEKHFRRMSGWHRARLEASFRAALAVDISMYLSSPEVSAFMTRKIAENVDLIKTIPPRFHAGMKRKLERQLKDKPFDQKVAFEMFRDEYKSAGYNLRRLTRDQTQKTVAGLTEIRHRQIGLEEYQWITAQDERVRPTHVANSGRIFRWADPPSTTGNPGNDILCRCVASPIVSAQQRKSWKDGSGAMSITGIDLL